MQNDPWLLLSKHKYPLIIIGVGILAYVNMLFNGFVWDDKAYIILNPQIQHPNLLELIGHNNFNTAGQYRPLPAIIFALFFFLFKNAAIFYHLFSLSLHLIVTFLLFTLFSKFFSRNLS